MPLSILQLAREPSASPEFDGFSTSFHRCDIAEPLLELHSGPPYILSLARRGSGLTAG